MKEQQCRAVFPTLSENWTYLSCGDHNANLLDGLSELIGLDSAVIVEIEVLEGFKQNCLFVSCSRGFLRKLLLKRFLETK
jgi:hypothetical protein